jgi:hypothetical protein
VYKHEIEAAIGYNQLTAENAHEQDAFASPDTVCKYCGDDFKFFRALKHHLRSHSSCHYKPFMCKLCANGFSTKANCMRHIQKQHLEVEQNQIENHIEVNEIPNFNGQNDDTIPQDVVKSSVCGDSMLSSTPVSLPAWSLPIPRESPIAYKQLNVYSPTTYITTPPVTHIKPEPETTDSGFDQPLDFSMKSLKREQSEKAVMSKSYSDEVPMDLSFPKPEMRYPTTLYPGTAHVVQHLARVSPHHVSNSVCSNPMRLPIAIPALHASLDTDNYRMLQYNRHYLQYYNTQLSNYILKQGLQI